MNKEKFETALKFLESLVGDDDYVYVATERIDGDTYVEAVFETREQLEEWKKQPHYGYRAGKRMRIIKRRDAGG